MARKSAGGAAMEVMQRVNAQMKSEVVTLGSDAKYEIQRVPTGILTLDRLLYGGFARGRHVEIFGDWLVGKSLALYSTLALAQKRGEVCALVDAEGVFNAKWFKRLGGDPTRLIMASPKNANTLGNILRLMIQKGDFRNVDIIGIDSVASLLPKEEEDYDLESDKDVRTASLARLMSLLLRQLTMQNDDTLFIWTNQWRDKISRIPNLKSTPGGLALGFYASTRIEMTQGEKEMEEVTTIFKGKSVERKRVAGRWIHVAVRKEKTGARPESNKSFLLDYDSRVPLVAQELIDLGMEDGWIVRQGDSYIVQGYEGKNGPAIKAHGIKKMRTKIEKDDELREWLKLCIEERTAELGEASGVSG